MRKVDLIVDIIGEDIQNAIDQGTRQIAIAKYWNAKQEPHSKHGDELEYRAVIDTIVVIEAICLFLEKIIPEYNALVKVQWIRIKYSS